MKKNKYEIKITGRFKKDLKIVRKREYFDVELLNNVIEMLANDITLPAKYNNHLLEPKSKRIMGMSFKTRLVIRVRKRRKCISINSDTYRLSL